MISNIIKLVAIAASIPCVGVPSCLAQHIVVPHNAIWTVSDSYLPSANGPHQAPFGYGYYPPNYEAINTPWMGYPANDPQRTLTLTLNLTGYKPDWTTYSIIMDNNYDLFINGHEIEFIGHEGPAEWGPKKLVPAGVLVAGNNTIQVTIQDDGYIQYFAMEMDAYANGDQCVPPTITLQPTPANVALQSGNFTTIQIAVSSTGPVTYQWQKDGVNISDGSTPDGGYYSGTTTPSLTIWGYPGDTGSYRCIVGYPCGSLPSSAAFVMVRDPNVYPSGQISAGGNFTLVAKNDGTAWSWGGNDYGNLGDGTVGTDRLSPVRVSGLNGVLAVSAGSTYSLALRYDGTVWGWGDNYGGELGDGTYGDPTSHKRLTPVQTLGLTQITAICAGGGTSMALKSDGTVWAWGNNYNGEIGDGTTTTRLSPVYVRLANGQPLSQVVGIAMSKGGAHAMAVKSDGTVWTWGYNATGQLGDGTTIERHNPVPVNLPNYWIYRVSAGWAHCAAVATDGNVLTWGDNSKGQLGDGTVIQRNTPVVSQFAALSSAVVVDVECGYMDTFAACTWLDNFRWDGTVRGSGWNYRDALGNGSTVATSQSTPTSVSGLTQFSTATGGGFHSVAVLTDLTSLRTWGGNNRGQLGDGTRINRPTPVPVANFGL